MNKRVRRYLRSEKRGMRRERVAARLQKVSGWLQEYNWPPGILILPLALWLIIPRWNALFVSPDSILSPNHQGYSPLHLIVTLVLGFGFLFLLGLVLTAPWVLLYKLLDWLAGRLLASVSYHALGGRVTELLAGEDGALRQLADAAAYGHTRKAAAESIQNADALRDLALRGAFADARAGAALRLGDPALLESLVLQSDAPQEPRADALARLTAPEALARVAQADTDEALCLAAVMRVEEEADLQALAMGASNLQCRCAAAGRLRSPQRLASVLADADRAGVRLAAATRLQEAEAAGAELAVPALVAALRDESEDVRISAAQALKNLYRKGVQQPRIAALSGMRLREAREHYQAAHTDAHTDESEPSCSVNDSGLLHTDYHTDYKHTICVHDPEIVFEP